MGVLKEEILNFGKAKKIIGIVSGKGGVGKSTVTASLAVKLAKNGYKVGLLDADILGPSIPRIFGLENKRGNVTKTGETDLRFEPIISKLGIKLASFNFYTTDENQAFMWRGPLISSTLTKIFTGVNWEELDYLLIDMPPGTSDTALTVMQSYKIDGIIAVGTPQKMVSMIVDKIINMAKALNVKVYGLVENMAYLTCPHGEKMTVFGKHDAKWHANQLNQTLLAEIPINHDLGEAMDEGRFEDFVALDKDYDLLYENFISIIN